VFEILYGRNSVYEALRARRRRCHGLMLAEGAKGSHSTSRIIHLAQELGIPLRWVSRKQLDEVGAVNHQGVAAQMSPYPYVDLGTVFALAQECHEPPLLLLLDCLQDPQNLATLLRTAEVVGVHGVVMPRRRAAEITPAVSNASAGAVEHLLIVQVTNLVRSMEALKHRGVWLVGVEHMPGAEEYNRANLKGPLALVVGSEGQGLRRLVREKCDMWISLPMRGKIGSLNVSVAGSIALYEAWQQRRKGQESRVQPPRQPPGG